MEINVSNIYLSIYNDIGNYYIQSNGDKNHMISNILINIKENNLRIQYINLIDLYISNINEQKETVQFIKSGKLF